MRIGVIFPQTEIGADPAVIRDYAETAEELGFQHIGIYDHVLGASIENRPNWRGPYTSKTMFHEVMVLFGYLAAVTRKVELVTDVLVLPQRQTALVAKQTAEVDVLSGGRLRLGVGVGWNEVEYEALREDFHNRGKRVEEQIAVLRALWTTPVVTFHGRWHDISEAGIHPLPVQQPIPLWMGGSPEVVLERVARIGDGWFPQGKPDDTMRAHIAKLRELTQAAGRDLAQVGIEARVSIANTTAQDWVAQIDAWRDLGATHLGFNTMGGGLQGAEHVLALRRIKEAIG